jgi:hypothetical protein
MKKMMQWSLWMLIIFNFFSAVIILVMPYSFSHTVEKLLDSKGLIEAPLLEQSIIKNIATIPLRGDIEGHAEVVKENP